MDRIRRKKSAGMDTAAPRLRMEQKQAKKPAPRANVRRRILWGLAILIVLTISAALFSSPWFNVRTVKVSGLAQLSPLEAGAAEASARIAPRTNIFRAKTKAMEQRLKALPFVADAHVSKTILCSLAVKITPRRPVALLDNGAQRWELDGEAVPIREARADENLPEISVPDAAVQAGIPSANGGVAGALKTLESCSKMHVGPITKIAVDPGGDLCLNMNDGVVIRLGQPEEIATKVKLAARIYGEDPGVASKVESIDISNPERPACTPRTVKAADSRKSTRHRQNDTASRTARATDEQGDP